MDLEFLDCTVNFTFYIWFWLLCLSQIPFVETVPIFCLHLFFHSYNFKITGPIVVGKENLLIGLYIFVTFEKKIEKVLFAGKSFASDVDT